MTGKEIRELAANFKTKPRRPTKAKPIIFMLLNRFKWKPYAFTGKKLVKLK